MGKPRYNQTEQCYLCGKFGSLADDDGITPDHIPAKCFSPNSSDSAFQFAPAHNSCNRKYSHEESKCRDYFAAVGGKKGIPSADAAWEKAERNFMRGAERRDGTPSVDALRLLKNRMVFDAYTKDGNYEGERIALKSADDVDVKGVIAKIARGLHYVHTDPHQVISDDWEKTVYLLSSPPLELKVILALGSLPIVNHVDNFSHYRGGCLQGRSMWYICIYRIAYAIVILSEIPIR